MIIGIDFHDTISKYPKVFRDLSNSLKASGHTVYIISAVLRHNVTKRQKELKHSHVSYDHFEIVLFDDHTAVPQLKLEACKRLGVQVMFDNNEAVCQLLSANKIIVFKVL